MVVVMVVGQITVHVGLDILHLLSNTSQITLSQPPKSAVALNCLWDKKLNVPFRRIVRLLLSLNHSVCLHGTWYHCALLYLFTELCFYSHSSRSSNASFSMKQPPVQSSHSFAHLLSSIYFTLPFVELVGSHLAQLPQALYNDKTLMDAQKGMLN